MNNRYAEQILNNPVYNGFINNTRIELFQLWLDTGEDDAENRENTYRKLKAIEAMNDYFKEQCLIEEK